MPTLAPLPSTTVLLVVKLTLAPTAVALAMAPLPLAGPLLAPRAVLPLPVVLL